MPKQLNATSSGDTVSKVDAFRTHQFDSEIPLHHLRDGLDPSPELSQMGRQTPLIEPAENPAPGWLATGRDEVRAILGDSVRFRSQPPAPSEEESTRRVQAGNLLQYDPPEHTRLRQMLAPEFTVRQMRRLEPLIADIVAGRLDDMQAAGSPADLMRHFAWPIPGLVNCALIGIPRDDWLMLQRKLDITHKADRSAEQKRASGRAYSAYMSRLVARQRRNPGQDLLGRLIRKHGTDVTDAELAGLAGMLMLAGLENAAGMLGLGILALLEHPEQLALLRNRPELIDQAVEDLIRYISVLSTVSPRTVAEDVSLAGRQLKAGEVVVCSLLAINRAGGPADGLDITRADTAHMAFGYGVHHCIGAALARLELRVGYLALLRRFPGLKLAVPREELRFRSYAPNYNLEALPVAW